LSGLIDTNVLVRHLTGDPPEMAKRATRFLSKSSPGDLVLVDLVVAEVVYVLESFYKAPRGQVAEAVRSIIGFDAITVVDQETLLRTIEIYEVERLDFAEAYLVAVAESADIAQVVSFDQSIDRMGTVRRVEP
jgi:predicted nucleic-acid-binding protein